MFELHPTLQADTFYLGQFELCDVLLTNNSSYLWLVLVPRRALIREIHELTPADQQQLMIESSFVSQKMAQYSQALKMNWAAFGNQVPQLHLHLIARHADDAAWPQPVWLNPQPHTYDTKKAQALIAELRSVLHLAPEN